MAAMSKAQLVTLMPIRKMDRAIKFYTKALGAKVEMRGTGSMKEFWSSITIGTNTLWLITPERREKRALAYTGLVVPDIRATVSALRRQGVKFLRPERSSAATRIEGPIAFEPFGASAFFKDSEGNVLMLWQNPQM